MAVEAGEFIDVNISVAPTSISSSDFGSLGFLAKYSEIVRNVDEDIYLHERGRTYNSLAEVKAAFASPNNEIVKCATAFFAAKPTPTQFTAMMQYDTAVAAHLVGSKGHDALADLIGITTGTLNMDIDGTPVALTGLDFSSASSLVDVATVLDTAVSGVVAGADVWYEEGRFVIWGNVKGAAGTITACTGTTAGPLGLEQGPASINSGVDAETVADAVAACIAQDVNFVGLVLHKDHRDITTGATGTTVQEVAALCDTGSRVFMNTSNNLACLDPTSSLDAISVMKTGGFTNTLSTFSNYVNEYPAATAFGRIATVDYTAANSVISLNLKQLPGVSAENLTSAEFNALRAKNGSAVVQIGTTGAAFVDSKMANGGWLDNVLALMWLEDRIRTDLFNLLYTSSTKIPQSDSGLALITSVLDSSLQAAVSNGMIAPGLDDDGVYYPKGYEIISPTMADDPFDANRYVSGYRFTAIGAGAIHGVTVSGSFSE